MAKVPIVRQIEADLDAADRKALPQGPFPEDPTPLLRKPLDIRAGQTVALAELLAMSRTQPAKERAGMQRQLLADPRAWTQGEWLDD